MAIYNKKKLLQATTSQIPQIANAIKRDFEINGYEVQVDELVSGGSDISITKGNLFKAVLGMRSALKVTLTPEPDGVLFDANVGIFGQQVVPSIITYFFLWPVLITQIWGLIEQSSLDDRALEVAERAIAGNSQFTNVSAAEKFCTNCGEKNLGNAQFCTHCGTKL